MPYQFENIDKAFSKRALYLDEFHGTNPVVLDFRKQLYKHIQGLAKPGCQILDLNASTGIDAIYFAQNGFKVHAIDISTGMIKKLRENVERNNLTGSISIQRCSYTDLNKLNVRGYDYVLSNFSGLNFVPDLLDFVKHLTSVLNEGAYVTLVIMPYVCLWEIFSVFKLNFIKAFRRFRRRGAKVVIDGEKIVAYYHNPNEVKKYFKKNFKLVALEGMGVLSPSPEDRHIPSKYPNLYRFLKRADEKVRYLYPFNSWGDHYIITFRYCK